MAIVDATTPTSPGIAKLLTYDDASGMAVGADHLYLLLHSGTLVTLDITQPQKPTELHQLAGLGNPWKMAISGNRGYVADNSQGLVVVNLDTPEKPTLGSATPTAGSAQDIDLHAGYAYVAVGSNGVEVFSLSDPDKPESVALVDVGGGSGNGLAEAH